MQAPEKATAVHVKRTLINVYLFCYAPLTQSAIELLICVHTCSDPTCPEVLYIDFGVACGSSEHRSGFTAAVVTLLLFTAAVPAFLLLTARRSVAARDAALHLRYKDMRRWFDELDRDGARLCV